MEPTKIERERFRGLQRYACCLGEVQLLAQFGKGCVCIAETVQQNEYVRWRL